MIYRCLAVLLFLSLPLQIVDARSKRVIVLSIDGLPGYYIHKKEFKKYAPYLYRHILKSKYNSSAFTVNPSLTYPAHTSMVTGKNPAEHGILYNSPDTEMETTGWMWYFSDIKSTTLYDYFRMAGKTTASVYWPVTAGADITWNIPQIWITKQKEDGKLLRLLSTPGLYQWLEKKTGITLVEKSSDRDRFRAGMEIWNSKKPDLMLLYSMDLDTEQHVSGPESRETWKVLREIDRGFAEFVRQTGLYKDKDTALLVVSDHGFNTSHMVCNPNTVLAKMNLYKEDNSQYYFKSLGGIAVLLKHPKKHGLSLRKLKKISDSLQPCQSEFVYSGDKVSNLKKEVNPGALGFLISAGGFVFRQSAATELAEKKDPVFTHGFVASQEKLKTVISVYPAFAAESIPMDIKQVFYLACKWAGVTCAIPST